MPRTFEIPAPEALARTALAGFGIAADARVTFVNYRENHVFRIDADGTSWALKLHRPGYRTDAEIRSESAVLASLAEVGVRAIEPVRALDGGHLVLVPAGDGLQQVTLQRWLDGARALGDSAEIFTGGERPSDADLTELGRLAGRMHLQIERDGAPPAYERGAWDAAGLVGPAALWGTASELGALDAHARRTFRRAEERLAVELRGLPTSTGFGPIHADLTMENVFADDEGLVLIDFDDSGAGWFVFDLATAFVFFSDRDDADQVLAAIVDGYRQERPLSDTELAAWDALLVARVLTYFGWSVERPDTDATRFHLDVLLPRILGAVERYADTGSSGWATPLPADPAVRTETPR